MDLDEMLRVDICRDTDELINFWAGCRNRIVFLDIVRAATRNFITSGKSHVHVLGARRCSDAWFYSPRAGGTTLSEVHALHRVPFSFSQPNVMVKFRRVHFCGSVNTGWVLKNVWLYLENFTRRAHCYYATLIASRTSIRGAFCDDALYKLTFTFTYHLSQRVFSNDLEWLYEVPSQLMEASPSWKST